MVKKRNIMIMFVNELLQRRTGKNDPLEIFKDPTCDAESGIKKHGSKNGTSLKKNQIEEYGRKRQKEGEIWIFGKKLINKLVKGGRNLIPKLITKAGQVEHLCRYVKIINALKSLHLGVKKLIGNSKQDCFMEWKIFGLILNNVLHLFPPKWLKANVLLQHRLKCVLIIDPISQLVLISTKILPIL